MDATVKALGGLAVLFLMLFVITIAATAIGAVTGWAVGLIFGNTILDTLSRFGVNAEGLPMWQLGATLGFVGGFFRYSESSVKPKKTVTGS